MPLTIEAKRDRQNRYYKKNWLTLILNKRKETGICETCNHRMKDHPVCKGCGILVGNWHESEPQKYRGMILCWYCVKMWKKSGRITWEQMEEKWLRQTER